MKIRYKILCDVLAIFVVSVICYFIFGEKIESSMIGVFTFSITIGIFRAKDLAKKYISDKEMAK